MEDCKFNMVLNKDSEQLDCICKYNRNQGIPCEYLDNCKWSIKEERKV
jgi:hypothetical protein